MKKKYDNADLIKIRSETWVRIMNKVSNIKFPVSSFQFPAFGFTLLEILIAIFIFSIIVTTVFGSYNAIFSNIETIDKGITDYEMAKNCLNRMVADLRSIHVSMPPKYAIPDFDAPPDPYRIVGDTSDAVNVSFARLRFTSLAHIPFEKSITDGIAEIVYYVQDADDGNYVLRRADTLYPYKPFQENKNDPVLCEGVKSLTFKYYDHKGTEYEDWDSESDEFRYSTPMAISIRLELGMDSDSQLFETMVTLPVCREKIE